MASSQQASGILYLRTISVPPTRNESALGVGSDYIWHYEIMVANPQLVKVKSAMAAEICANFNLDEKAKPLLREGMGPREFMDALVANKQFIPGIDFVAHALPAREAIWWGCLCLQHACGSSLTPAEKAAARAAVQWVMAPSEENRAAAKAPTDAAGPASPAGSLANAVFQTGGNIAPPKAPPIAPGPFAPAKSVSAAVKIASAKADPAKIKETQRLFFELGIGVAEGRFG